MYNCGIHNINIISRYPKLCAHNIYTHTFILNKQFSAQTQKKTFYNIMVFGEIETGIQIIIIEIIAMYVSYL